MLTEDQVKKIVNGDLNPRIKAARAMKDKLRLHVDGIGLQAHLERINNYENAGQFEARKKHAISNKFLSEELLRPVDNAFHARGGSRTYIFSDEKNIDEFVKLLMNVKGGTPLSDYMENEWFHWFVVDPNGLIFMEVQEEEIKEEVTEVLRPTYKSISEIRDYEQNGIFVDWVIFEPHVRIDSRDINEDGKEFFWAVDEKFYYLFKKDKNGITLIKTVENSFERVPAILTSNITDHITGWKKSPIDSQIQLLDKYLLSNSVLSISEFFHNYLQQWTYIDKCNLCNGTGNNLNKDNETCQRCEGTGQADRKDVTDIIKLKIPEDDAAKIDPPAGFIFAPLEAWEGQVNSVDRSRDMIYFSHWGTLVSREKSSRETATGRFLDAQPVNNRLNKYSVSIETAQSEIAQFIGEFEFPKTFESASVQKGRRYLIETPDQIWKKYLDAKKENAPISTLDLLLGQFLESEFRENEQSFLFEVKKSKLEPFVHWDVVTVQSLNVAPIDYAKKLYFSDWADTKEIKEIVTTPLETLDAELTTFAEAKIEDSKSEEPINTENNE